MKLAPLTARTFEAFCRLGYPYKSPPKRCILIEHEGAVIAGVELIETEGARFLLLQGTAVATWVDPAMQARALKAIAAAARSYCAITGQPAMAIGINHPAFEGWQPQAWGMIFNPFERAPDAPAAPQSQPPAEATAEPAAAPERSEPVGVLDLEDEDAELLGGLRSDAASSPARKRTVRRRPSK